MHYQSPFRFVEFPADSGDSKALQRLKRQLLTEFDLNDQQPLVRDGVSLSRNEALSLFDALTPQTWPFHRQIWANKPLLALLETGELPTANWQETLPDTPENQSVYAFVLPYYASRYADALVQAYDAVDPDQLGRVLALPLIDAGGSTSLYYRRVWSRLIQIVRDVERWIDELASPTRTSALFSTIKTGISQYEKQTVVLALLPAYFKPAIYQIASAAGHLFLQLNAATWLYYWLKRRVIHLMQGLGPEARQLANDVSREQIQRVAEHRWGGWSTGSGTKWPSWYYYVFIAIMFARAVSVFTKETNHKPTAPRYNTEQLDSIRTAAFGGKLPIAWSNLPANFVDNQLAPFAPAGSTPLDRPATGSHPLENWLVLSSGRSIDTYNEDAHIEIQNRSSQDAIGCFYCREGGMVFVTSYYIRAGDTQVVTFLHSRQADGYGLRWLAGKTFSQKPTTLPVVTPVGFARPVPVVPDDGQHKAPYAFRSTTVDEMSRKESFQTLDTLMIKSLYLTRMRKSDREPYTLFCLTDAGQTVVVQEWIVKP